MNYDLASKDDMRKAISSLRRANEELESKLVLAMNKYNYLLEENELVKKRLLRARAMTKRKRERVPKRKLPPLFENFLMKEKKWPKGMASYLSSYEAPGRFPSCKDSIATAVYLRNAMGPQAYRVLKDANLLPLPSQSILKQANAQQRKLAEEQLQQQQQQQQQQQLLFIQQSQEGEQILYEVIENPSDVYTN